MRTRFWAWEEDEVGQQIPTSFDEEEDDKMDQLMEIQQSADFSPTNLRSPTTAATDNSLREQTDAASNSRPQRTRR